MKIAVITLVFLAGCQLRPFGKSSTVPVAAAGSAASEDEIGIAPHPIAGTIVRSDLEKIVGMTVPEAKGYLGKFGFTGNIVVYKLQHHIANCERDRICSMDSEAGIGVRDDLVVYFNEWYDP